MRTCIIIRKQTNENKTILKYLQLTIKISMRTNGKNPIL
uniref:GM01045p n=1 Tax=Drosophila melanogaster TaxID=7227 RepID=Q8T3J8_DROME|nr:GM01045p [Drosophila melanogaster]